MIEFNVQAMSCGHCIGVVTETIHQVDPNARVEVDLAQKKVKVDAGDEQRQAMADALTGAGYPPA
jgi:copper chaperone